MKVLLNTDQIETTTPSTRARTTQSSAPEKARVTKVSENSNPAPAEPVLQANVTLRRDTDGKIYYVFTDGNSGKELREFPPSEVRKAGQGVEELLRETAQKAKHPLDTKA